MSGRIDRRSTIAVTITIALMIFGGGYFGWYLNKLSSTGWAGLAYFNQPHQEKITELSPLLLRFVRPPGEIAILVAGGPAAAADMRRGDRVVSIDGISIGDQQGLRDLAAAVKPGQELTYVLRRGEETIETTVEMERLTSIRPQMAGFAASLITALGFLLISMLLFSAGPRSRGALLFFQLCTVGALFFLFSAAFEFEINDSQGIIPVGSEIPILLTMIVYLIIALVLMNLLLHFSLVFPRRAAIVERRPAILLWLHLTPFTIPVALFLATLMLDFVDRRWVPVVGGGLALAAIAALARLRRRQTGSWKEILLDHPLVVLSLVVTLLVVSMALLRMGDSRQLALFWIVLFLIGFFGNFVWATVYLVMTLFNFIRSYRTSGGDEKRQLRWPLWGTIVSLLATSTLALLLIAGSAMDPPLNMSHPGLFAGIGAMVKFCYLLIPISFGLGIQKYGLMQIDTILRKTFIYAAVTTIVIVAYLLIVGVFGVVLVSVAGVKSQVATVAATLVVAALFIPVRNRVQTFVDARFFKRQQDYDSVRGALSRVMATSRNLEEFLETSSEIVRTALGVPRVLFFCREPLGKNLILREISGQPLRAERPSIAAGDAISTPGPPVETIRSGPLEAHGRYALRLQTAEGVIGALLIPDRPRDPLSNEDLQFLAEITDPLALGVSSLQIRTDDIELFQARQIQRSLLPREIPQIRGIRIATAWIPARSVGGDYYDVIPLSASSLAVCVGDVVGKGMPAALLMSGLQSAVRAIAPAGASPDVTVQGIRRVAAENLQGGKFITFFYATIDTDRNLRFTNAGHNEPLLITADGSVERLSTEGAAIARMMRDAELSTESRSLRTGDTLVIFTDGVTEAPDASSSDPEIVYGEDRLIDVIRRHRDRDVDDLVGRIVEDVRSFTGGEIADDLTLVVLQAV